MPVKSEAQRKAMYAALEGHSNLGISKSVAKKFVGSAHDAGVTNHAAGILFVAPDGDVLMLRRGSQEENYAGHWALPGGKAEEGESPEQAADREATEEMGRKPDGNKKLLDQKLTPNGMAFHTFAQPVSHKFTPKLNPEHSGFCWASLKMLPQPMHPAVADTLSKRLGQTKAASDMTPEDWDGLVNGMVKWLSEEELEDEHDEDNFEDAEDSENYGGTIKALRSNLAEAEQELRESSQMGYSATQRRELQTAIENYKRVIKARELAGKDCAEDGPNNVSNAGILHLGRKGPGSEAACGNRRAAATYGKEQFTAFDPKDQCKNCATVAAKWAAMKAKREGGARDAKGAPEHKAVIEYDGDFDWDGFLKHLHRLGGIGASRRVSAEDENDNPIYFGWDGDGADKIQSAVIDGHDILKDKPAKDCAEDAKLSHTEVAYGAGKPTSNCSICQYFEKGAEPHCQLVEDPIEPEGWCKLFTADQDKILGGQDKKLAVDEKILQLAMDRCIIASGGGEKYALDFAKNGSVREYDADGHLHVKRTPISKSNVCPYLGEEIPDAKELNLDPQKVYQLLRHPDELAKAAATSNGKPIMRKHIPVSSDDHKPYDVIGATGNEAEYEDPYLYNSLVIWPQDDIDAIESEDKVELSSGYRYKAVMTPGTFKGVHYDGIMTELVFNHVASVEEGRAGSDVRVMDSTNPDIGWAAIEEALLGLKENAS